MLDDPIVASPPAYRTRQPTDARVRHAAAAVFAALSGLLLVAALFVATQRIVVRPIPSEDVRFVAWTKVWLTGRTTTSGAASAHQSHTMDGTWPNWLLAIAAIVVLLVAAAVLAAGRRRLTPLAVGLVAAGLGFAVTDLLSVVGERTGDVGGGTDMQVTLLAGWWLVLASAVVAVVALLSVWWAGRAAPSADPVPAD